MSKQLILGIQVKAACGVTILSCQLQWYHIILDRATEATFALAVLPAHPWVETTWAHPTVPSRSTRAAPADTKQTTVWEASNRSYQATEEKQPRETVVCKVSHSASTMWMSLTRKYIANAGHRMHKKCLQRGYNCTHKHTTWHSASALLGLF